MNINKVRRSVLVSVLATMAIGLGACTDNSSEVKPPQTPGPSPSVSPTVAASPSSNPVAGASKVEALVGRWAGVEGTYLNVTKKGEKYSIEIADLDGPKAFEGTPKGDTIEFTRNGKTESIKAATGSETGMKGFEKETNCVVVTKGSEGFCRK